MSGHAERCTKISPGTRLTCIQSLAEGWITSADLCGRCTHVFVAALESAVGADEPLAWHHAYAERAQPADKVSVDDTADSWIALPGGGVRFLPPELP